MTRVLCINVGSRSAKVTLLEAAPGAEPGDAPAPLHEFDVALDGLGDRSTLDDLAATAPDVVAYRVVRIARLPPTDAIPFDAAARAAIADSQEFAPLHTRTVLAAFDALSVRLAGARHVAVFDAGCHRTIADRAAAYGLPYADFVDGWRKVGFHGLSYRYAAARVARLLGDAQPVRKLVGVHLGGGCSVAAIDGARSVDTSMGFTPQDGLLMATRSGSLDPGMLLAYMRRKQLSIDETENVISAQSGLFGLGGFADMRDIQAARVRGDARATLAYDAFVYRAVTTIGAMAAALDGVEAIAFLGGIGEHIAPVRADICRAISYLGVHLSDDRNATGSTDAVISAEGSSPVVLRLHVREDWMMALAATDG